MEAASAGIELAVIITEGAPVRDMQAAKACAVKNGMMTIGPNCPGVITAEECKIGIMPGMIFKKGNIGLISKSGTLTYEGANQVCNEGFGISTLLVLVGTRLLVFHINNFLKCSKKTQRLKLS